MNKNVGLTYVKDFSFPAEQGFTGSAGVHKVKGYMRGGHVKKTGTANAKHGGHMKYAEGGKFGKPGDKYPNKGAKQTMPANVKSHGGSVHDRLKHEGGKMGYRYGGQVKNTSAEFVEKHGKQDTMDHGVQPAQTGRNQQEVEAGGNKRLKPGYKKGGTVAKKGPIHQVAYKGIKKLKGVMSEGDRAHARRIASGRKMPKNVKAKGGLAKYAHGGAARKPYSGYNAQAGGSGNEDARYMQAKK